MEITKEQFKELAKKHLTALEGYDINRTIEIFGVGKFYDEVIKIEQQKTKMKKDMKEEIRDYKLVRWYPSLPIKWDSTHSYQYNRKLNVMVNITLRDKKIAPYVQSMPLIEPDFIEYWEKNKPKPLFKAGDILVDDLGVASLGGISIFKCINADNDRMFDIYVSFDAGCNDSINIGESGDEWDYIEDQRLATEEEKQMLFDALKKQGKRWNAETLEIENIKSEFKRGDILASRTSTIVLVFDKYTRCDVFDSIINNFNAVSDNDWKAEIFRHASAEEIEVFYKALARRGKKWNAETLEVEKLDISEIVVDYESAIKYLGIKDLLLVFKSYDRVDKFNAQIKLQLIAEAWNKFDEFEADWENSDQYKYYPMFIIEDGKFEISGTSFFRRVLNFHTSSFSFKTEERAKQFGEQFIDLFKVALGL